MEKRLMPTSRRPRAVEVAPLTRDILPQLVALQSRHLKSNLTDLTHGFLNWATPLTDLVKYADLNTSFTVSIAGELIAYMLTVDLGAAHQMTHPKLFLPMPDRAPFDEYPVTNYRACIGQVLVERLYATFFETERERYGLRIVGIRKKNRASYCFCRIILGMKPIGTFGEKGEHQLLTGDLRKAAKFRHP